MPRKGPIAAFPRESSSSPQPDVVSMARMTNVPLSATNSVCPAMARPRGPRKRADAQLPSSNPAVPTPQYTVVAPMDHGGGEARKHKQTAPAPASGMGSWGMDPLHTEEGGEQHASSKVAHNSVHHKAVGCCKCAVVQPRVLSGTHEDDR